VFRDKPGGLVVDYLRLADQLKKALSHYTGGDRGDVGIDKAEAIAKMLEKHEVIVGMLHGFDYSAIFGDNPGTRIGVISATMNHIHEKDLQDGKTDQSDSLACQFINEVSLLSKAFVLAVPDDEALRIRDEVGFFQAVRAELIKYSGIGAKSPEDLDHAIRQLVSKATATDRVIDIFADAGLKKPEISILSDEFLAEVSGLPHKNLALELLRKLLNDEVKARSRKNVVEARSFLEMLEKTIKLYQNRSIETAEVIAKLIEPAREMREAHKRGEKLNLTDDELAFYDALEVNDSAVKVLGDLTLRTIARELVEAVRKNVTIDWAVKESARAKMRTIVRRLLRKYGYPPTSRRRRRRQSLSRQSCFVGTGQRDASEPGATCGRLAGD
jgi:type I restriction enzyme R subunit